MKVLVVDDIRTNLMLTSRVLEKRGHEVRAVEKGTDAILELCREDYDLVVMDVQMPDMSGIEAARIIRSMDSNVRCHDVPILAFSATDGGVCGMNDCLQAGMNGYLVKPMRTADFVAAIEQYQYGEAQD